ncbi:glycosyltransferase family 4 protein [Salinicoccus roseus]|uniref:Glycosyl transferase family 1 n=1 Tax=Salinicoccus roseus TaxID=45670 RepID=A0A265EAM9_9STAP|nr:glycosyltransferase family 4 protein [Salinicoccus roseus]OZT78639.1 glycosyl transferase family 1 [Salinicoccus roseus]
MKILWLTNIPLPEASYLINEKPIPTGGWLINASKDLSDKGNIDLSIVFPGLHSKKVDLFKGKNINYYRFPAIHMTNRKSIEQNKYLEKILKNSKPDIVHIFGTEYAHSLAMVNICKKLGIKTIISIQGLVSIYAKHFTANLPIRIQKNFTLRDFIKQDNILQQQKKFFKKGELEIEAIQKVDHIIGRTTWDRACTYQINSAANYHHCNETLRDEFYNHKWSLDECEEHSIFISQAAYPIKGLHYVLEALPLILKRFPNTKLYVAGIDITSSTTLKSKLKKSSYAKYIGELIDKYKLKKHIVFTGSLDEKEMCKQYLRSNVFVSPSSIENSPNSLGEAMILGVPSIASDVGGVSDLLEHKEEGFIYQADAPYMLAYYVGEIFKNKELALRYSRKAREHALKTHNKGINTNKLVEIYKSI